MALLEALVFLGTSSGVPTLDRGVSCTALAVRVPLLKHSSSSSPALSGETRRVWWLIDCGEGTQQQILRYNASLAGDDSVVRFLDDGGEANGDTGRKNRGREKLKIPFQAITRVLITHLHGDHCFGLPGLLAMRAMRSSSSTAPGGSGEGEEGPGPLEICGPAGVRELAQTALRLSRTFLPFDVVFRELPVDVPFSDLGSASAVSGSEGGDERPGLVQRVFGPECRWRGDDQPAGDGDSVDAREADGTVNSGVDATVSVVAARLDHRVPCFGYVFREQPGARPGVFDAGIAQERFGVPRGPDLARLAKGHAVEVGDRLVTREDCRTPPERARVAVVLGDTSNSMNVLPALRLAGAEDDAVVDALLHESTFEKSMREKAFATGHSTSEMAGEFAERVAASYRVRCLTLFHFSQRYPDSVAAGKKEEPTLQTLRQEAIAACPGVESVIIGKEYEQLRF
jgi:ribonuclease Z